MLEWCMAHPWMTFFLAAFAIDCLTSFFGAIVCILQKIIEEKSHEN